MSKIVQLSKTAIFGAALLFSAATGVNAATITGGTSTLTIDDEAEAAGLMFSSRDATVETSDNVFAMSVTGGTMDGGSGTLAHSGSVITIDDTHGATTILWDFVVDTTDDTLGVVHGNLISREGWFYDLSLFVFDISDLADNVVDLYLTSSISARLTEFYGFDAETFAGMRFGTLELNFMTDEDVLANPVPAALPVFLSGIAGLSFLRRRRRNRTA